MAQISVEVEPGEVGLDAGRLARVDTHFARYVDDGRLAGWQVAVARRGRVAHLSSYGLRDIEAGLPVETDTLWRIYSMTKPVTSVAALTLWEEGAFELKDELSRWLPELADMRVWRGGTAAAPRTEPATEPIRVWHLLTHTAGLTYGFTRSHPVDELYRLAGFDVGNPSGLDLAGCCARWATLPLVFNPGTAWNYSVATDVLGRLLEVVTGQRLDEVIRDRVLAPLGMTDSRWWVDEPDSSRLAALYAPHPETGAAVRYPPLDASARRPPAMLSGGGGLVSTAADYHRFAQMLLGRGELDGVRVLGPRTVAMMTRNYLPGGADLETVGTGQFAETQFDGVGFGLGVAVVLDPAQAKGASSAGEMSWGGLASTAFWVDPVEDLTVVFLTQLVPSSTYPLRSQLRQLVHQAIVD